MSFRAERRPDAELVRPLLDGIGNHAVNADDGEENREPGEETQQAQPEAFVSRRHRQSLAHWHDVVDGDGRVHFLDDLAHCPRELHRIAHGSYGEVLLGMNVKGTRSGVVPEMLLIRNVDHRPRLFLQARARIGDDAHDFARRVVGETRIV